ncbi:MAG: alpha/beta hydrolase [Spirochaetia bacterium]
MHKLLPAFLVVLNISCASDTLRIIDQGSFSAGGEVFIHEGVYQSENFDNWQPYPQGQTYHADHASVFYQIPQNRRKQAMVFLHGAGQSARSWQTTPDGRDGFQNIFLKRRFATYLIDQPRRGQAGRSMVESHLVPVADEQMWFEIWRMGKWPQFAQNIQFPQDQESLSQFWRWMTPNTGHFDVQLIAQACVNVFSRSGKGILLTHSQGGLPGWIAATKTDQISAIVSYEPGTYLFPEMKVPDPMPSRTGILKGVGVSLEEFKKLTQIPIIIYFGDYIPKYEDISENLGAENWRVRLELGRQFVQAINEAGGNAQMIELPREGIFGNTHFLFAEKNNVQLANHLQAWLKAHSLD